MTMLAKDRLIVALDVPNIEQARSLIETLGDSAGAFFPGLPELPLMLAFFGLAHLAYIALFLRFLARRRMP